MEPTTTELWIAFIASGGVVLIFRELIPGLWKWLTGRQHRERNLLQVAYRDLDRETAARRVAQEELHHLRARVIQTGRQDLLIPQHPPTPHSIIETPRPRDTPPRH